MLFLSPSEAALSALELIINWGEMLSYNQGQIPIITYQYPSRL